VVKCGIVDLRIGIEKHVFQIDWTMCSKYTTHSRLKIEHAWGQEGGSVCNNLMSYDDEQDMHITFANFETNSYGHDLDFLITLH
jgi:hypothetical protein